MSDVVEKLKQLKELLDDGVLTQEEFDAQKKQVLATPTPVQGNQVPVAQPQMMQQPQMMMQPSGQMMMPAVMMQQRPLPPEMTAGGLIPASWLAGNWSYQGDCCVTITADLEPNGDDSYYWKPSPCGLSGEFTREQGNVFSLSTAFGVLKTRVADENTMHNATPVGGHMLYGPARKNLTTVSGVISTPAMTPAPQHMSRARVPRKRAGR